MTIERSALPVDIRPARAPDLSLLQGRFSPNSRLPYHARRFAVQQHRDGVYLIAWSGDDPVGHFLLRWEGPSADPMDHFPPHTPYLEAGATLSAYRRRGVATELIRAAERLARERGYRRIGLAVGSTDNPNARRLYERLGYCDLGLGSSR